MASNEDFEYFIKIPVPLGEKVWTFKTDCGYACRVQGRKDPALSCQKDSPCQTLKIAIHSCPLMMGNLEEVIEGWGVFYFKTSAEAEEAGNQRVKDNINKMREIGYAIDKEGRAHWAYNVKAANRYNEKH
jgi:hypothetical protein